ncbi:MAG: hypothetical protein NW200_11700 [Hyphomonadaceae bacterium]|nr:hypothetical protein [Hyphomonadaceae bacterium]
MIVAGVVFVAVCSAILAGCGAAALALSRTRLAGAIAFAATGLFCGVAATAMGAAEAGLVLIGATAVLTAMTLAAGALLGEMVQGRPVTARVAVGAAVAAGVALVGVWAAAPAVTGLAPRAPGALFAVARGGDLFIALCALAGVAGVAASLLGFGERGVLGPDRADAGKAAPP